MICNICGSQEATIHLTEIVNNQMVEVHLCETCAQEKGTDFKTHFNFGDVFASLNELGKPLSPADKQFALKCQECGMTYEEFGKIGRLGCAACYDYFAKPLMPLIKRVQRSTSHVGKKPSRLPGPIRVSQDLKMLRDRLKKSVQMEAFEDAARLRDEIRQMEEKTKKPKKNKNDQS